MEKNYSDRGSYKGALEIRLGRRCGGGGGAAGSGELPTSKKAESLDV